MIIMKTINAPVRNIAGRTLGMSDVKIFSVMCLTHNGRMRDKAAVIIAASIFAAKRPL
jgi:hypothetical protein